MHMMNNLIVNTLSADIEKKPGPLPVYVDPSKACTIAVQSARRQSLCSLIYNKKQGISSEN